MAGRQEDTSVNRGIVAAWAVTIVAVLLFSGWLSVRMVHARVNGPVALPTGGPGQTPRFGVLETSQLDGPKPQDAKRESDQRYLHGWGWVDDAHSAAHVPISRAEELLLAQHGGADAGRE